jgi:endonuclease/exonuclease/phosphatase family metal-dependent hydrolase
MTILTACVSLHDDQIRATLPAPGPDLIRVMSLNICYGAVDKITCPCSDDRRTDIAELIANTKAGIIGFQEANNEDNFVWIAEQLGYYHYWSPEPGRADFQTGVMSRFPLSDGSGLALRNSAAKAKIDLTATKSIYLVSLHLTPDFFGDHKRAEELTKVINWIESSLEAYPHIVLGDFNTDSTSVMDLLIDVGFTAANIDKIDHIFINDEDALKLSAQYNLKAEFFSPWPTDHPAVLVDIDISGVW